MKKPIYYGKRIGTKRADRRWESPDGELWDSRYEYLVYRQFKEEGYAIHRCTKSDTISFTLPIRGGQCRDCESSAVGQLRHYTPDFYLIPPNTEHSSVIHYIEAKGYLRPKERALLRALYKEKPDTSLSILFQRSYPAGAKRADGTKSSIVDWTRKFLPNFGVYVWNGKVPNEFKTRENPKTGDKAVRKSKRKRASRRRV